MKKQNNITPQLIHMWEKSIDPWGAKDFQSNFIYANSAFYQLLNLPKDFNITGLNVSELPSPIAEYEKEFHYQDKKVMQTMQRVTTMETHLFGKDKIKQSYLCDKYPLYDDKGNCIGITFHLYKIHNFSASYYYDKITPKTLEFVPPNNILTQTEWEILFLLLRSLDENRIGKELNITTEDVINYILSIYQKFNLSRHVNLKEFFKEQNLEHYIPERHITIGSIGLS
ncbi:MULTISPECIES: PAS domain-containing protein [Xenorhabdus]|uniref:PAS domain-containing protein n=1 Tax=Xenorhabdus TaxID=626 RepID=UPI000648F310|nr:MULTISPECIES: PAS domain-containing protein [Xenorhabdus]